ncbi:MAG: hypothetical protein ACTSXX_06125 [Candidatus Baldrarchaeia archaeon]
MSISINPRSLMVIVFEVLATIMVIIMIFAVTEYIIRNYLGIDVSFTKDVWSLGYSLVKGFVDGIKMVIRAIFKFIAAPFEAFYRTLMWFGLDKFVARIIAYVVIIATIVGVVYGVVKWRRSK